MNYDEHGILIKGYRYLEPQERLQDGDEFTLDGSGMDWGILDGWEGTSYTIFRRQYVKAIVRRKL